MAWFKVDDGFYDHPKVLELSPSAVGTWLLAGAYSAKHLTDGFVSVAMIRRSGGDVEEAASIVSAGLWDEVEGGWQYRNWAEYQPTRDSVEAQREYERDKKRRQRRNQQGQFTPSPGESPRDTPPQSPVSPTVPTRPDPSRPVPSGGTSRPGRKRPPTPIPDGWTPTPAHASKASELRVDLNVEADRFRNWHLSKDSRFANWNAAFSNWLTKAGEFAAEKKQASGSSSWEREGEF